MTRSVKARVESGISGAVLVVLAANSRRPRCWRYHHLAVADGRNRPYRYGQGAAPAGEALQSAYYGPAIRFVCRYRENAEIEPSKLL